MANSIDKFEYVLERLGKDNPLTLRAVFEEELYNMDISDDRFKNWDTIDKAFILNTCVIGFINPNLTRIDLIQLANNNVLKANAELIKEFDMKYEKELKAWTELGNNPSTKPEKREAILLRDVSTPQDLLENWFLPFEILNIFTAIMRRSNITNYNKIINDIIINRIIHVDNKINHSPTDFYDDIDVDINQIQNYSKEFIDNINYKSYSNCEHIIPNKVGERLTYYGNDKEGKSGKYSKSQAVLLRYNPNNDYDKLNIDKLKFIIDKIAKKIDNTNEKIIELGIESIRRELYKNTPIDTGNLVKNWRVSKTSDDVIEVHNELDYADKVERGYFDGVFWHPGYYTVEFAMLKGFMDMIKFQEMIQNESSVNDKSKSNNNSESGENDNFDIDKQNNYSFNETNTKDDYVFDYEERISLKNDNLVKLSIKSNKAIVKPIIILNKIGEVATVEGVCNNIGNDYILSFDICDISVVGDYTFSLYSNQELLKKDLKLKIEKQGFKVKDNH